MPRGKRERNHARRQTEGTGAQPGLYGTLPYVCGKYEREGRRQSAQPRPLEKRKERTQITDIRRFLSASGRTDRGSHSAGERKSAGRTRIRRGERKAASGNAGIAVTKGGRRVERRVGAPGGARNARAEPGTAGRADAGSGKSGGKLLRLPGRRNGTASKRTENRGISKRESLCEKHGHRSSDARKLRDSDGNRHENGVSEPAGLSSFQRPSERKNPCLFHGRSERPARIYHEIVRFSESSRHFGLVSSLSGAFKGGKEQRNQILSELSPLLWLGDVSAAVAYLKGLNPEILRPKNRIEELQNYLEERREQIPCYALRSALGLRISSNRVEKANDMVVARRQKHNGMSWSETGSGALAQIAALFHNGGLALWLDDNRLSIFPAHSA